MKSIITMKSILTALLLIISMGSYAQGDFKYRFSGVADDDKAAISIVIERGSTCQGIYIERSLDSLNFTEVGHISGVCGSADFDQSYQYTDNNPVPDKRNYYRVRFGLNGPVSNVIGITFVAVGKDGYKLTPNPIKDNAILYFNNPDNNTYKLEVYDLNGKTVLSINNIKSEKVLFNVGTLENGTYSFRLSTTGNKKISGKFIVAR
jgi:hypothetical protein